MKIVPAALLALALFACSTSPDPIPGPPAPTVFQRCGTVPQLPPLRYTDSDPVVITMPMLLPHAQWSSDIAAWAKCAGPAIAAACMTAPTAPTLSFAFAVDGSSASVDRGIWTSHMMWVNAMEQWGICADGAARD